MFGAVLAFTYGLLPLAVDRFITANEHFVRLGALTVIGVLSLLVGFRLPLLDVLDRSPKVKVRLDTFIAWVWGSFALFVAVALVTAEEIPVVAAFKGVDPDTLAVLRERFLKAREGWQATFPYVNAVLAGALVPYSLMVMQLRRHPLRWVLFLAFLVYCVSFVEKTFFLRAAIPLVYIVVRRGATIRIRPSVVLGGAAAILTLVTLVSGVGKDEGAGGDEFFTTTFSPSGPGGFLFWRAVAIPVVTAADALRVFEDEYGGAPLRGATSSFFAGVLGVERVNVERDIFAAQWGQNETETGNANSVYLTEAFLNFGTAGVVVFSLIVGLILRIFERSGDEAFKSLWPLFCFGIYVSPLTSTLLSNGFLLVIGMSYVLRLQDEEPPQSRVLQGAEL